MNKHIIDQSSHEFNMFLMQVLKAISVKIDREENKELPPLDKRFVVLARCYKGMISRAEATRLLEELNLRRYK